MAPGTPIGPAMVALKPHSPFVGGRNDGVQIMLERIVRPSDGHFTPAAVRSFSPASAIVTKLIEPVVLVKSTATSDVPYTRRFWISTLVLLEAMIPFFPPLRTARSRVSDPPASSATAKPPVPAAIETSRAVSAPRT